MDDDSAKLFVGGISRETSEDTLRVHFNKYGAVSRSLVARDRNTKNSRGFGFVWFSHPSFADKALRETHVICGRTVEVKKAISKNEQMQQQKRLQQDHFYLQRNSEYHMNRGTTGNSHGCFRSRKIFVGGLSDNLTEQQFKKYFERFGRIVDIVVMQDSMTSRPRGFGFVTFDSEESVNRVMLNTFHELNGRRVEVKRAVPKDRISGRNYTNMTDVSDRNSFKRGSQPGIYSFYAPEHETPGVPTNLNVYDAFGGYLFGPAAYGVCYPNIVPGKPSLGSLPISHWMPWTGPIMIGAGPSPLYNNPCLYPAYMNEGFGITGVINSIDHGIVRPDVDGKSDHTVDGDGHPLLDASQPRIEELKLEDGSSDDKASNGGTSC